MKIAYIDMIGGVSGDMLLGALVNAGLPLDDLRTELDKLQVGGFELSQSAVKRGGIDAMLVGVDLDESGKQVRNWDDFENAIDESSLSEQTKATSLKVFDLLAKAESAAHGVSKEETHLHELGTVDTLVDVVGVIAGLELLGVERVHASPFPLSAGTSKSSHGVMAATAAATAAIYRETGVPVRAGGQYGPRGEAVTPTGAALVATIAAFEPTSFTPESTGYGAGNRNPEDWPNVVGLWIGETTSPVPNDLPVESNLRLLETNIDDMTGEALAYVQERLMDSGALDAWLTPIQMKKGRPATLLSVLCRPELEPKLAEVLLLETTTLGVRRRNVERYVAEREMVTVNTKFGEVPVKVKRLHGEVAGIHPEHEQCREIAMREDVPLREVVESATHAARELLGV